MASEEQPEAGPSSRPMKQNDYPESTPHLNQHGLLIRSTEEAGRGVFASSDIPAGTLIEVSPVLIFPADEYEEHGKHTQLDSYTFVWRKREHGRNDMALALGLGSLFNHHPTAPNVSYQLDHRHQCIRYTTVKSIAAEAELCISYGAGRMWWEKEEAEAHRGRSNSVASLPTTEEGEWTRMSSMNLEENDKEEGTSKGKMTNGHSQIVESRITDRTGLRTRSPSRLRAILGDCPLWRVTAAIDPMTVPLQLIDAWAIDIPARLSSSVISFAKTHACKLGNKTRQSGWAMLQHLRTIRQVEDPSSDGQKGSLLCAILCLRGPDAEYDRVLELLRAEAGFFSEETGPFPRIVKVPAAAAPCKARLQEWNAHWPTSVRTSAFEVDGPESTNASTKMVDRQADKASWTPERLAWAKAGFKRCLDMARKAKAAGELPVGVHVTEDFEAVAPAYFTPYSIAAEDGSGPDETWRIETDAYDTRCSERNPIKHAVLNAIRKVADLRIQREKDREKRRLLKHMAPHVTNGSANRRDGAASPGVAGIIAQHARLRREESKGSETESDAEGSSSADHDTPSPPGTPQRASSRGAEGRCSSNSNGNNNSMAPRIANGQDYLLNSLTLFTTHEPCAYCSMALVHSRVRAVYFLQPAPHAGGCCGAALSKPCEGMGDGGPYAVQEQSGLNHRFEVWRWMAGTTALGVEEAELKEGLLEIYGLDP